MRFLKKAVLFDIDGTLVKVGGAGREAVVRGMAAVLGVPVDTARQAVAKVDFRGRTDTLLFEEIATRLGRAGVGLDPELVHAYLGALEQTLAETELLLLPGISAALAGLEEAGATVGLLTGNIREGARRKLTPFGLEHLVQRPGGFGDDGRERAVIARLAVERLVAAGVDAGAVVVVGDTEHDVSAARAAGARAVAVATGWTAVEVLEGSKPDLLVRDLGDCTALFDLLGEL